MKPEHRKGFRHVNTLKPGDKWMVVQSFGVLKVPPGSTAIIICNPHETPKILIDGELQELPLPDTIEA